MKRAAVAILGLLLASGDAQPVKTRNAGDVQVQLVGSDKVTVAPVSTSTPAGTEAGLLVRVVSQPAGGAGVTATQGNAGSSAQAWYMRLGDGTNLLTLLNGSPAGTEYSLPVRQVGSVAVTGPLTDTQLRASAVPVSGTVTANQGAAAALSAAWPVKMTDGTNTMPTMDAVARAAFHKLTDGTNTAAVKAASTAAAAADPALVCALSPNSPIPTGSNVIGAVTQSGSWTLAANQSMNLAQVAGATVATGNGAAAGTVRVSVASDNSAVAGLGVGATGAAVPANAVYQGSREGANIIGVIQCDKSAKADIATATTTAIVAVSGSTTIYVCSYIIEIQGVVTTAGTAIVEYGSGTACATSPVVISPTWTGSTTAGNPTVFAQSAGQGYLFKTIASQGLCLLTTTTTPQRVFVTYAQL